MLYASTYQVPLAKLEKKIMGIIFCGCSQFECFMPPEVEIVETNKKKVTMKMT